MPKTHTDFCCGIIPIHATKGGNEHRFLLVKHNAGHWGFPKGHPEPDETHRETARRECLEETGLLFTDLALEPSFDEHYRITKKSGKVIDKTVRYFLGYATDAMAQRVQRQEKEIAELAWGTAEETMPRLTFDAGRDLFTRVLAALNPSS